MFEIYLCRRTEIPSELVCQNSHAVSLPWLWFCCSKLFDQEAELNWVIFHDVLVTSRMYIRTVCPIRYEWVKDLLPKLHEVDVYELSSVAREEVTEAEMIKWETAKRQPGFQNNDLHN